MVENGSPKQLQRPVLSDRCDVCTGLCVFETPIHPIYQNLTATERAFVTQLVYMSMRQRTSVRIRTKKILDHGPVPLKLFLRSHISLGHDAQFPVPDPMLSHQTMMGLYRMKKALHSQQ